MTPCKQPCSLPHSFCARSYFTLQLHSCSASSQLVMLPRQQALNVYTDMLGYGEHGPALAAFYPDHGSHRHHHSPHNGYLPWALLTVVLSFLAVGLVFKAVRHCRRPRSKQQPTLASQLSELALQSDTVPNPLVAKAPPAMAVQAVGIIPKSDPDWIGNVPWSDWQIDQEDILLCRRPDGRLWELGTGASAKVSHGLHVITHLLCCWHTLLPLNHALLPYA